MINQCQILFYIISIDSKFSNITKAIVNIDDFKVHENKDGTVDRTKTDLYLHLVSKNDNSIIEVSEVLRLVDEHIEQLDELFKEFNVLDTQASDALVLQAEFGNPQMIIWLVMINLIMGALLIIIVTLCLSQRTNYRRELKAARVNAFGELWHLNKIFFDKISTIFSCFFSSSGYGQNSDSSASAKHQQAQHGRLKSHLAEGL
jgi:hypothetical protein